MTEFKFAQLLGSIDPEFIARAEAPVRKASKPGVRIALIAAALALIALLSCAALLVVPYIPTTLELDYPAENGDMDYENVWIYYTDQNGRQKREYVRLPYSAQNVFAAWAHLNQIGEEVALYDVQYGTDNSATLTVSTALEQHPASEALLNSLQKTYEAYSGIPEQSISFVFSDHPVTLRFSHNLTDTPIRVNSGNPFTVTVTMTNISNEDIVFEGAESDFVPRAKLLAKSPIYVAVEIYPVTYKVIYPEENDQTAEIAEYRLAPGESKSFTYTFRIPYATNSILITGHDLTVYFGEQSQTFEKVVTANYSYSASAARPAFEDFTLAHTAEDRTELQGIWDAYTYQGANIMEQMSVWSTDGSMNGNPIQNEGGALSRGEQLLFQYSLSQTSLQYGWIRFFNYALIATVLPDGMTLPMGITEQDNILEALIKMGVDEQTALEYLAKEGTVTLAGADLSYASSFIPKYQVSIDLVCDTDNYVIRCTVEKGIIAEDDPYPHATRTVSLVYDPDSHSFLGIRFDVTLPTRPNITFDALPTFTEVAGLTSSITLTQEQADALVTAMTLAEWKQHEVDAEYDCQGKIGEIPFKYSSVTGQLAVGDFTVQLYGNDMIELNGYLGIETRFTIE